MSILKNIRQQIKVVLNQCPLEIPKLESELNQLTINLQPTARFPQYNEVQSKDLELVYVSLTVQDILETEFYYSYLILKPLSKGSQIHVFKYGFLQDEDIKLENYQTIMESRQTLMCVSDFYQTNWIADEWKGVSNMQKPVPLKITGKNQFRLGQRINAVCVWNPFEKFLVFVRKATQLQIEKQNLDFQSAIKDQEVNTKQAREFLRENLEQFLTKPQALMILLSMISNQPMFLNGQNISEQLSQILPRVNHVKIKAPFKSSLFPYKNNEGELVQTQMQMSSAKTFVILDFSQFSQQKQIKIDQAQIDNLKALKMFVEEGKTVFRWQYGESLIDHKHSGIIVRGSKIVNPHFYINEQPLEKQQKHKINPFKQMDIHKKHIIRIYIQKCQAIQPKLNEQQRKYIEIDMKEEASKFPNHPLLISERMQIARLLAKSLCKTQISFQDYKEAKQILQA